MRTDTVSITAAFRLAALSITVTLPEVLTSYCLESRNTSGIVPFTKSRIGESMISESITADCGSVKLISWSLSAIVTFSEGNSSSSCELTVVRNKENMLAKSNTNNEKTIIFDHILVLEIFPSKPQL
jgi:hypothetical protein